jgi:hypothetical protein
MVVESARFEIIGPGGQGPRRPSSVCSVTWGMRKGYIMSKHMSGEAFYRAV